MPPSTVTPTAPPPVTSSRLERVRRAAAMLIEGDEDLDAIASTVHCGRRQLVRDFQDLLGCAPVGFRTAVRTQRARDVLARSGDVLRAVYASGFQSSSHFYEVVAPTLGMSPATFSGGAAGQSVLYSTFDSPHGTVLVAATEIGLCSVDIGATPDLLVDRLVEQFPRATVGRDDAAMVGAVVAVRSLLSGSALPGELPVDVRGTAFQRTVWEALRRVPAGATVTYADLAREVGRPSSVRAVANACGQNRLALVIPCHRAVRSDGTLGGYRWGIEMKTDLLTAERNART